MAPYEAEVYDSKTNLWSKKEEGLVCGLYSTLYRGHRFSHYYDYDCSKKLKDRNVCDNHIQRLNGLNASAEFVSIGEWNLRIFKLKQQQATYGVSEFARGNGTVEELGLREINSYESSLEVMPGPSNVRLMATERFLLSVAENCTRNGPKRHMSMGICDRT